MLAIKQQARVAGLLYLLSGLTAPFSLIYVPRTLIVPGDATATADHVRASVTLLRLGMASEVLVAAGFIFVGLALYRLFKSVDERQALAMVLLISVAAPISFLNTLNDAAALVLTSGASFLSVFGKGPLDALALLFLRLHGQGVFLAQVFWGLWLFPFGRLVIRSGFIPRWLGVSLMIAGTAYVIGSFAALFAPGYFHQVSRFTTVLEIGEAPIIFWLLIWGAREQRPRALQAAAAG
jgi:hypothetical protein